MISVISPAKSLDFETEVPTHLQTEALYIDRAELLIKKLRTLSRKKIGELMSISTQLAELNFQRYQDWTLTHNNEDTRQALLAFKGDVYIGLDAYSFSDEDFNFAQEHLNILSGLYGILRPLDEIRPYRLEMGTKLPVRRKKNLYEFWGDTQVEHLNKILANHDSKYLINLASNEYFKSVNTKKLDGEIITPEFKDFKNGEYKMISFLAKKARGMMSAFIIKNRIDTPQEIKRFDTDGYAYNDLLSDGNKWVFTRD